MKKGIEQSPLRKAVEWLKKEGKIKRDNDLEEIFDLKKATISTYLSGSPSVDFPERFEKHFNISLKDFEGQTYLDSTSVKKSDDIAILKAQVKELTRALAKLNEIVTKEPAIDYYLSLEKKMREALIGQQGE